MSPGAAANAVERAAWAWSRPSAEADPTEADSESDATSAIVAHGLLGNLAVIRGAVRMLLAEPTLSDAERKRLLQMVDAQVDLVQGVLTDLVRGLPSHALAALDDLSGR